MNEYLAKLDYGKMKVDSTNIDIFWFEGDSRITQFEQIDFLKRFYNDKIGIAKPTTQKMKDLMIIDKTPEYTLSGKTGWVVRNDNDTGWFVGYIEKDNNIYFIATNIQPEESCNMDMFPRIRIKITLNAFKTLGIIEN
jgi:beta-lactamase class D